MAAQEKSTPNKAEQTAKAVTSKKVGQAISNRIVNSAIAKGIGSTLGSAAGSVVPVVGNVVGGLIGGAAAGAASEAIKNAGKAVATIPFIFASAVAQALGAAFTFTIGGLAVLAFFTAFVLFTINSGAYIVPPGSLTGTVEAPANSIYIDVTKTANPSGPFENSDLPLDITYTIQVSAPIDPITNIRFSYSCSVTKEGGQSCPPEPQIPSPPEQISPGEVFTIEYSMNYGSDYADSLVFDSLQVTADAGPNTNEVSTGSASVIIGDPPLDCPSGWPIVAASGESLPIWQGPRGSFSHSAPLEAIDILASSGHSVVATHNGVVERTYPNQGYDRYGKLVFIRGNCNGRIFYSMYAHLTTIGVSAGDPITFGQEIGVSGNTGTGSPHLHYEFRAGSADTLGNVGPAPNNPPFMAPPYLPKEVPEACVTSAGCGVSVP